MHTCSTEVLPTLTYMTKLSISYSHVSSPAPSRTVSSFNSLSSSLAQLPARSSTPCRASHFLVGSLLPKRLTRDSSSAPLGEDVSFFLLFLKPHHDCQSDSEQCNSNTCPSPTISIILAFRLLQSFTTQLPTIMTLTTQRPASLELAS
jgi:hypothetical protein